MTEIDDNKRQVILPEVSVSQEKINQFGKVTGGEGKIHTSSEYAKHTVFKKTLVHGLYLQSLLEKKTCKYFLKSLKRIDTMFLKPVTVDRKFKVTFIELSKNKYKVFIESQGADCVVSVINLG